MKKMMQLVVMVSMLISANAAFAQAEDFMDDSQTEQLAPTSEQAVPAGAPANKLTLGGRLGAGFSFTAQSEDRPDSQTAKFSGAMAAYIKIGLTETLGLETGLGFQSQGSRFKNSPFPGMDDVVTKDRVLYMEIPVMLNINVNNFQIGAGLALVFALSGKTSVDGVGASRENWDGFRRVNIGPKFSFGYKIPVGPVAIVPSVSWFIHLVNDLDTDMDVSSRYNNLLFNVAVEFGIK
jgi:hypothetical protein